MNQAGLIQSWAINHAHSILWVGVIDGLLLVMADLDVGSRPEHDASCVSGLFGISQLKETLMCLPRTSLRQTHILHVFPVVSHWLGTSAFLLIQWLSKPICVSAPGTYLTALRALRPPYVFTWSLLFKCCHLVFQLSYPLLHWRKGRSSYSLSCFFLLHLWHRRKKGNIIFTVLSFFTFFSQAASSAGRACGLSDGELICFPYSVCCSLSFFFPSWEYSCCISENNVACCGCHHYLSAKDHHGCYSFHKEMSPTHFCDKGLAPVPTLVESTLTASAVKGKLFFPPLFSGLLFSSKSVKL